MIDDYNYPTKRIAVAPNNHGSFIFDVSRIAINEGVYMSDDCSVTLSNEGYLTVTYETGKTRTGTCNRLQNRTDRTESITFDLNLGVTVKKLKYFLVEDTVDSDFALNSPIIILDEDYGSFLFLELQTSNTSSNNAQGYIKLHEIVIEFPSDSDMKRLVTEVGQIVDHMKVFTNDPAAKLNVDESKEYGKALLVHSQQELQLRRKPTPISKDINANKQLLDDSDGETALFMVPMHITNDYVRDVVTRSFRTVPVSATSKLHDANVPLNTYSEAFRIMNSLETIIDDISTMDISNPTSDFSSVIKNTDGRGHHNQTVTVKDYWSLGPEGFLTDPIIDLSLKWIIRMGDNSMIQVFNSFFYTKLRLAGVDGVKKWTLKINIFEKRLLFIPINKNLHWSMVVVVNPAHIALMKDTTKAKDDDPACFFLFMDSIKKTPKKNVARRLRVWLNSEWRRVYQKDEDPFNTGTMVRYTAKGKYKYMLNNDFYELFVTFLTLNLDTQNDVFLCGV